MYYFENFVRKKYSTINNFEILSKSSKIVLKERKVRKHIEVIQKCYIKIDFVIICRSVELKSYISCYNQNKKRFNCIYNCLCVKLIIAQKIHSKLLITFLQRNLVKKLFSLSTNSIKILCLFVTISIVCHKTISTTYIVLYVLYERLYDND